MPPMGGDPGGQCQVAGQSGGPPQVPEAGPTEPGQEQQGVFLGSPGKPGHSRITLGSSTPGSAILILGSHIDFGCHLLACPRNVKYYILGPFLNGITCHWGVRTALAHAEYNVLVKSIPLNVI